MAADREKTAAEILDALLNDVDASRARISFCRTVATELEGVASWLAVDAFIGGGDQADGGVRSDPDPVRLAGFSAVGLVTQIAADLATSTVQLFDSGHHYSGAALVRQFIECEYLLEAFRQDFAIAASWYKADDNEMWDFKPSKLRKIGGFSPAEYKDHCDAGGHPNRRGEQLLPIPAAIGDLRLPDDHRPRVDRVAILWTDFAYHSERVWRLVEEVLTHEHARFSTVRASSTERVAAASETWRQHDRLSEVPLARRLFELFKSAPDTTLDQLTLS